VRLKKVILKGFMRFKDRVEINFPENQVTLIAGENGSGKTAILDAICCALYGKTFRTSGTSVSGFMNLPDLTNHESSKAEIGVEFESHGHNYVVTREILRTGSRGELLEDGETKAIGHAVYNYVKDLAIGLDWEGFRKSTVILQGEMSALTNIQPAERKESFKKLFGLDKYDLYEDFSKEKVTAKEQSIEKIKEVNKLLLAEIEKIPQLEKKIQELKNEIEKLEGEKKTLEEQVTKDRENKESLEKSYNEYIKLKERLSSTKKELERLNDQVEKQRQQIRQLKILQRKFPKLEKAYKEFQELESNEKDLEPTKREHERLQGQLSRLNTRKETLQKNLSKTSSKITKTKKEIDQLRKVIPSRTEIERIKQNLRKKETDLRRTQDRKVRLESDLKNLTKAVNDLEYRLASVKGQERCPVCFQKIKDPNDIKRHYDIEIGKLRSQADNKRKLQPRLLSELESLSEEVRRLRSAREDLQRKVSKKEALREKEARLQSLEKERDTLASQISGLSEKVNGLSKAQLELGFDEKDYQKLSRALSKLREDRIAEKYADSKGKMAELPRLEEELAENVKKRIEESGNKRNLQRDMTALGEIEANYKRAKEQLEKSQEALNTNRTLLAEKTAERKGKEGQLNDLRDKEKKVLENKQTMQDLERDKIILETLRGIFKSVPEDILRRLRPFIEREGTDIINDLSNGEITALNVEEENLNVSATINGQVRPIHYFSGGQKTRINMALRVAISRILSKLPHSEEHTFATMNTLFIDEGDFGDLDESGIREAVNVIRNLTKEFSRVVVISHVDAIKDIFHGQMIEVLKTGSEVSTVTESIR